MILFDAPRRLGLRPTSFHSSNDDNFIEIKVDFIKKKSRKNEEEEKKEKKEKKSLLSRLKSILSRLTSILSRKKSEK